MGYNLFRFQIIIRLLILLINTFLLIRFAETNRYALLIIAIFSLAIQIIYFIKYVEKVNHDIIDFLRAMREDRLSAEDQIHKTQDRKIKILYQDIFDKYKETNTDLNAEYQYLKAIVQNAAMGIITFNNLGDIQILNHAMKRLIGITVLNNLDTLKKPYPELFRSLKTMKTGGRELVNIEVDGVIKQLSLFSIELTLKGEEFKLVCIQNIKNELEEKEMDAWQNIIKVLTHEIMNSITPISSLSSTVSEELKQSLNNTNKVIQFEAEDLEDFHLAVSTIQKRSEGLMRFVNDFRNLTHIPVPKLQPILVTDFIESILKLLDVELKNMEIKTSLEVTPKSLGLKVDPRLIEQVVINMIKNAMQAMEEETTGNAKSQRLLRIEAERVGSHTHIRIIDNGKGIKEEALSRIFIPFYTTKRKGSGIGLSISRQIMRQHQGRISVSSKWEEGTSFTLKF